MIEEAKNLTFSDFESHGDVNPSELLTDTNRLLWAVGLKTKKILSIDELSRVASSLFVAVFESLFHMRIDGIVRNPQSAEDYENNAQLVIDNLSDQIQVDLKHITGTSIVNGDLRVLSNLVHILARIVSLTSQESLTSYNSGAYENDNFRGQFRTSHPSSDSISTHESAFESAPVTRANQQHSNGAYLNTVDPNSPAWAASNDKHGALYDKMLRDSISKAEQKVLLERRMDEAHRRREHNKHMKEARARAVNLRREEVSRQALQRRWIEDADREHIAQMRKQNNEEHVMLRKIYKGLLKNVLLWRIEEEREEREKKDQIRDQTKWQIESLQQLFEERLKILLQRERVNDTSRTGMAKILQQSQDMKTEIATANDLVRAVNEKHKLLLAKERNLNLQRKSREILRKSEAHRDLLSMLCVQDWQDMLRSGYLSPPKPRFKPVQFRRKVRRHHIHGVRSRTKQM